MPPKRKPENKGLPTRWCFRHGAYYYQVPPGQESAWSGKKLFRLGDKLSAAYKVWADRLGAKDKITTIGELLDRYALEVVPTKKPRTQTSNILHIKKVRATFGHQQLTDIKPVDIYQYNDKRSSKTEARQEIAVLRHAFTKAVEWGLIDKHPFKGEVRIKGMSARTRYVSDDEVIKALALSPVRKGDHTVMVQAYICIKLLTGMRQRDLLLLREVHITDDGIKVQASKTENSTGKEIIYEWSDELRAAVAMAREVRPVHISPYLFCDKTGKCFVNFTTGRADVWARLWQRFMKRLLGKGGLTERFTEHDLRAKTSSDAESDERARQLLSHENVQITRRVYRRKPERVRPLR